MEAFGEVLRARRLSRGLTQEELSRLAGVSVRAVRDIERGRVRRPREDSIRRLAAAVGLDPTAPSARPGADRLEIKLLGPLTVHRAGAPVDIGPPRQEGGQIRGTNPPPTTNTPPAREGQEDPHEFPRRSVDGRRQKDAFLQIGGKVIDVCGARPCYAGTWHGP